MKNKNKTKEQLMNELVELRQRIAELEKPENERKQARDWLEKESTAIAAVVNDMLRGEVDDAKTEEQVLDACLVATDSVYGIIGVINEHGKYDTTTYNSQTLEDCAFPEALAWEMSTGMTIRGIWGWPMLHGKPLLCNDLQAHPAQIGFPKGHVQLRCFLGVPLKRGGKVVGMVAVANKPSGYTQEDRDTLIRLASIISVSRQHREALIATKRISAELEKKTLELEQANMRLKELDRLKSMFIASMSHELRTPLNSIIGLTGIILQGISGEITEVQRKELMMVKNSADHLLALINDVIDVSRIETDQIELVIEKLDLAELIQEVRDSFKTSVDEKGLKMSLKMLERLIIRSDKRRTKQVIINFVSNALKFTDKGEIAIKAVKKDRRVEISVADTGIGIKKEEIKMLFKQFSRIHVEGRPSVEGAGLGLYLSKKISDLLGGEISAESEFGKGSKFTFILPLKYKEASP